MGSTPKEIRVVCGLGNSGIEYRLTRHNIGFAVVDRLAAIYGVRYWKSEAGCLLATVHIESVAHTTNPKAPKKNHEVLLLKPGGFMNTSGGPLAKLMRAHHVSPAELLVVHDEVDLAKGRVQAKWAGGLNAHNGLRSIADKLGTREFARVRCGIGRPPGRMDVATYVLRQLKGNYLSEFELLAQDGASCVEACLVYGISWVLAQR